MKAHKDLKKRRIQENSESYDNDDDYYIMKF